MTEADRTRTITWHDPAELPTKGAELGGLAFLRAIAAGELPPPPIMVTLSITGLAADEGRVEFECRPDESLFNPLGTVHGGVACALLDTAVACAGHSTLPPGAAYTSIDLHVQYLRPVLPQAGPFRAVGRVVKPGRRVIAVAGEMTDASGALVATATSSLLVLAPRS